MASPPALLSGQATTITTGGGMLRVHAPDFRFIDGTVQQRLRDGRSVRLALHLEILDDPRGATLTARRQSFTISFDLWEERFAVSRVGAQDRPALHSETTAAEAWCLEQLAVSLAELKALPREMPFWIRIESRVEPPVSGRAEGLTLGRLIDLLSRRAAEGEVRQTFHAGPFRLP